MTGQPGERLGSAAGLVATLVVGVSALAVPIDDGPVVVVWWWVAYGLYLVAFVLDSEVLGVRPMLPPRVSLAVLVVAGTAQWLLAPRAGWTAILFVVTAASAAFLLTRTGLVVVIAANSVTLALGASLAGYGVADVVFTTLTYLSFQVFAVIVVLAARSEAEAREELAVAHADLGAATALLATSSRNAERLRIARDLHDVVGHQLTALALELEVASHRSTDTALEHVTRARGIAKDLLTDVRATVSELRDAPAGLEPTLRALVERVPGLEVELVVDERRPLDEATTIAVVRCAQEILTNTVRHAGASRLVLRVTSDAEGLVLRAHDDGRGTGRIERGNGLTGMAERVEQLGGELVLESAPDRGFAVTARVPTW